MQNREMKLKTIRLNPTTIEYLTNKSKELQVSQGTLVTFAFNRMTEEDYKILKLGRELVAV